MGGGFNVKNKQPSDKRMRIQSAGPIRLPKMDSEGHFSPQKTDYGDPNRSYMVGDNGIVYSGAAQARPKSANVIYSNAKNPLSRSMPPLLQIEMKEMKE